VEADQLLHQTLPVMLHFMADEYDDTCSTIFPMLQALFSHVRMLFTCPVLLLIEVQYKKMRKSGSEPLDPDKRIFLSSLLAVILQKMKWDEDTDEESMDEDDQAAFEGLRKARAELMS
jgi:exportin-T